MPHDQAYLQAEKKIEEARRLEIVPFTFVLAESRLVCEIVIRNLQEIPCLFENLSYFI